MLAKDSFFDELRGISASITKEAAGYDFKSNPVRTAKRGALALGLGTAAYKGARGYEEDRKETAKDIQQKLTPEEQKKAKKLRRIGAVAGGALSTGTAAAIGYGAGKANEWARSRPEGSTILSDYVAKSGKDVGERFAKHMGSRPKEWAKAILNKLRRSKR